MCCSTSKQLSWACTQFVIKGLLTMTVYLAPLSLSRSLCLSLSRSLSLSLSLLFVCVIGSQKTVHNTCYLCLCVCACMYVLVSWQAVHIYQPLNCWIIL